MSARRISSLQDWLDGSEGKETLVYEEKKKNLDLSCFGPALRDFSVLQTFQKFSVIFEALTGNF